MGVFFNTYAAKTTIFVFFLFSLWWLLIQSPSFSEESRHLFSAVYGLMAMWGGLWGLHAAFEWGWLKSIFGKSLLFLSLGLLAQEFGQLVYLYHIYVLHIEVPYPSLGDLGYFGSIPLYLIGAYFLAKTAGVNYKLRSLSVLDITQIVLLPITLLVLSYMFFLRGYEIDFSAPLTTFLDFGYPLGQAIYVSVAILIYSLSRNLLGGMLRTKVLLLLACFIIQYFCDFVFLYQNSRELWEVGRINDLMYFTSYTLMSFTLLSLGATVKEIKK